MDIEKKDTTVRCEYGASHPIEREKCPSCNKERSNDPFSQAKNYILTRNRLSSF